MAKFHYVAKPTQIVAEVWTPHIPAEGVYGPSDEFPNHHTINAEGERCIVQDGDYIVPEADGKGHYPVRPGVFEDKYNWLLPSGSQRSPVLAFVVASLLQIATNYDEERGKKVAEFLEAAYTDKNAAKALAEELKAYIVEGSDGEAEGLDYLNMLIAGPTYTDLRPIFPSNFVSIKGENEEDYEQPAHRFIVTPSLGFEDGQSLWAHDNQILIQFVKKYADGSVIPGLQSEQLLRILIMRHTALGKKFPTKANACFITHLEEALFWSQERVQERIDRGVMGKLQA